MGIDDDRPSGAKFRRKRFVASRAINMKAWQAAGRDLPPLSLFGQKKWLSLDTAWEQAEFEYRRTIEADRGAGERTINDLFCSAMDEPQRARELKRFEEQWARGLDTRTSGRPGIE
jgi:hypothetical protein